MKKLRAVQQQAKELDWLDGEDNDTKQFEATVGDDRFKKLKTILKREAQMLLLNWTIGSFMLQIAYMDASQW